MIKNIMLLALAVMIATQTMALNQMRNWTLLPNQVYLPPSGSPSVIPISGASSSTYKVANGVYDESNNLLFYVRNDQVYNASSTPVGTGLPTSSGELKEIVIVPVPGACRQYYVIYANTTPLSTIEIWYTIVTYSSGIVSRGSDIKIGNMNGNGCGLAASKIVGGSGSSAIRYLYAVTFGDFSRFTITNVGIGSRLTLASPTGQILPTEADLSYDGTRFVFGETNSNSVIEILTSSPYTITPFNLPVRPGCPSADHHISGVEYDYNSNIWVSATSSCSNNKGLYKIVTSTSTPSYVPNSSAYDMTQLEMSPYFANGLIFGVSNTGTIGYLDPSSNSVSSTTLSIPVTVNSNAWTASLPPVYSLVDQIDGEEYTYFNGIAQAVANFQINGASPSTTCGSFQQVYNCTPTISFNNLSTGAPISYVLEVQSINSSCNPISGSGLLTYSSGTITTLPTDLKSMPGTNGTWLATHTGKYIVKLTANNGCSSTMAYAYIEVIGPPTAVTTCFTFANNATCSGAGVAGGTSCAAAVATCINNPKIKADCSGGQFVNGSFDIRIDEYNSACTFLGTIGNSLNNPLASTADLVCLSLNDFTTTPGYFYNNTSGNRYSITLTIRNVCSTNTITKWFINNVAGCKTDDDELETDIDETIMAESFVNLFPNPTAQDSKLHFTLEVDSKVSLNITDMEGRVMAEPLKEAWISSGEQQVGIPSALLANGIYVYHLKINDKIYQGKLIKTN